MQQRKDEILAKKAKLAELKRQRELRQREFSANRQSLGDASEVNENFPPPSIAATNLHQVVSPTPGRGDGRRELDTLISSLVGESRPSSAAPSGLGSGSATAARGSRPNSVLSAGEISVENSDILSPVGLGTTSPSPTITLQTISQAPLATIYDIPPSPVREIFSYSKGVQTTETWSPQPPRSPTGFSDSDIESHSASMSRTPRNGKRLSRREREKDEEIRQNIRREIEEELKIIQNPLPDSPVNTMTQSTAVQENFPARTLTDEELNAVVSSDDFMDFVERSSKVIERTLDQEYDVLTNYALGGINGLDDDDEYDGKGRRRLREIAQFWDDRWSRKRMISAVGFSPKFPELVLASYTKNPSAPHDPDGLIQVWNLHLHDRPEYIFHAQSDILTAKFSPFHPNLIVGGAYSGQVLLWDTRAKSAPVQKTPLTGSGHTHPVYSIEIVGTQNANNVISCSTDGVVCGWTVDMLAQPQELLDLTTPPPTKTEDLSPTCMAFPQADPTYFLVGTEEGSIYPCHRYDRAGAKAGVEQRVSYRGHAAPVMSIDFHPARGPIDLGDLVLSSSLDWSVKLWKVRAPAATATASVPGSAQVATPLLDLAREDVVYDARWSPVKPGVFSLVDGAGNLEIWDITIDTEVPVAKAQPSNRKGASLLTKSLNKIAWEEHDGKKIGVGGLDGVVTIFDVGSELGGVDNARAEEWSSVKKLIGKRDGGATANGVHGR
ncbi:hypothetical protein FGG08_000805 [Glutinoglossum americanum]|uniref:Cytoplasmic dynein 1 intermediate chain 2 n=1 Tax=Glutinoglossum americanum TaxID=1670608 RepID=A0A9P8I870_9PEZI|nr:hypothetical protein FGG08_000805 [Glutinoglossum americanum]